MVTYYLLHIAPTAVANFDCVLVENIVQFVFRRDACVKQFEEFLTFVCSYAFAVQWVKPCDVTSSLPPFFYVFLAGVVFVGLVLQFSFVSTSF